MQENIDKLNEIPKDITIKNYFKEDIKIVILFWIVGMSVVGTIVLVGYVGFKGYSLGYTISAILKLLGISQGNEYIFQNLFINNVIIVFIMIFMASYSIKIVKNFFVNKANLKVDIFKYTILSFLICFILVMICFISTIII